MTSKKSNYVFQLAGTLTTAGTTVAITNDLELNQTVTFTDAAIVLRNRNATLIERVKGTAAGGVLTLSKRGLTQADTEIEDSNLRKEWRDGTIGYVTILAPQVVDAQSNNTFLGDNTFDGAVEFNESVRIPVYADDTARDAAIPTPQNGMLIYNTALGLNQQYIGGAWTDITTGPVTPNASETVAGKVQEATQTEVNDATGTGSTGAELYVNPSKLPTGIANYITNNAIVQNAFTQQTQSIITTEGIESLTDKNTYLTGENVTAGDSLFREDVPTFAVSTSVQEIGDVTANTRVSIPVFGSGTASSTLKLALRKYVSPGVDLGVRIETDNNGNPSGTLIDPAATATVLESGLTTSLVDTTVTLTGAAQNNAHGVTLDNTTANQTSYQGVKITLTQQVSIATVVKDSDCTATTAYLYDINSNLLASTAFSTNTATFNFLGLTVGESYYILAGSGGSNYTSVRQTGSASFPYIENRLDYISGATTQGYIPGTNSRLYLKLDGNATDSSGQGNNGTATNVSYVTGQFGQAGSFNGSNSRIDVADVAGLNFVSQPFTISAWINKQANFGTGVLNSRNIANKTLINIANGYGLDCSDNTIRMLGSTSFNVTTTIPNNQWINIVVTSNGSGTGTIYLNGTQVGTGTYNSANAYTGPLKIGSASNNTLVFNGLIDDVIIENVAWTQQQVTNNYTSGADIITNTNLNNITDITTTDNILIPKGQRAHIVLFPGVYGSETINATNYFGVGYRAIDTTTRRAKTFNGTVWGNPTFTEGHGKTFNATASVALPNGFRILANNTGTLNSVTKSGTSTATRAVVYADNGTTLLGSATFSGNVATFSTPISIGAGTHYKVGVDGNGATYTSHRLAAGGYPENRSNINYVSGAYGTAFGNMTTNDANFWLDIIDITTTNFGGFFYTTSNLFLPQLLSKTDASFSYKIPVDFPRIATATKSAGQECVTIWKGLADLFSGLTQDGDYYLTNTAGAIGLTAGTNVFFVGRSVNATLLNVLGANVNKAITVGTSPFSWVNNTGGPVQVKITGGTVNPIVINGVTVATATGHINTVPVGVTMTVTYSSAPTIVYSDI